MAPGLNKTLSDLPRGKKWVEVNLGQFFMLTNCLFLLNSTLNSLFYKSSFYLEISRMNDIFSRGDPFVHRADEAAQQLANQRGWSPYSWHGGNIKLTLIQYKPYYLGETEEKFSINFLLFYRRYWHFCVGGV